MPNFGDFNFNDDADSVDTDPIPDNIGIENESSNDGIQNDKTNYPEPGQGKQFEGGDVSEFATNTNPEEPSGQQDEIPPINIDPKYSSTSGKKRNRNSFQQAYADDELFYVDPIDDALDTIVSFFSGKKKKTDAFSSRYAGRIDKIINQFEKDNGVEQSPETRTIKDFLGLAFHSSSLLSDRSLWTENLLDYFTREQRDRKARELGITIDELNDTGYNTDYESLASLIDDYTDATPWTTTLLEQLLNRDNDVAQYSASVRADQLLKETVDIVSDSAVVETLLANAVVEDELDVIVDTDDAESAYNPTGIGEMFDRVVIEDAQDVSLSLGNEPIFETREPRPFPEVTEEWFYAIEVMGAGAKEFMLETSDLVDDFGTEMLDIMYNSLDADLISVHNGALENWDGLL